MSERTEQPTARHLENARRDGNVPMSYAVLHALGMLVALTLAPSALSATAFRATELLRASLQQTNDPAFPVSHVAWIAVELSLPLLLCVAAVVALAGFVQTRGLFVMGKIAPDLSRISPACMFNALRSPQRLFGIARALLASLAVATLVVTRFEQHMPDLSRTAGRIDSALLAAGELAFGVARDAVLVLLGLAALDLVVAHRSWLSGLKMTKFEAKRDIKDSDGDPHLKSARVRLHQDLLQSATVHSAREATVIIADTTRLATAVRYVDGENEAKDNAPVLLAAGQGDLAVRLVKAARLWGIPIVQNPPVAQALAGVAEGDPIPPAQYEAVAMILRDVLEHDSANGD